MWTFSANAHYRKAANAHYRKAANAHYHKAANAHHHKAANAHHHKAANAHHHKAANDHYQLRPPKAARRTRLTLRKFQTDCMKAFNNHNINSGQFLR